MPSFSRTLFGIVVWYLDVTVEFIMASKMLSLHIDDNVRKASCQESEEAWSWECGNVEEIGEMSLDAAVYFPPVTHVVNDNGAVGEIKLVYDAVITNSPPPSALSS
jgi:hypothetical protein